LASCAHILERVSPIELAGLSKVVVHSVPHVVRRRIVKVHSKIVVSTVELIITEDSCVVSESGQRLVESRLLLLLLRVSIPCDCILACAGIIPWECI
jgi:hypothetical protein